MKENDIRLEGGEKGSEAQRFCLASKATYIERDNLHGEPVWGAGALSPLEETLQAAFSRRTESGIYGGEAGERSTCVLTLCPLFFLMVTFSKRTEFIGMVEGDVGVTAVNIVRVCLRVGSEKEGEEIGL